MNSIITFPKHPQPTQWSPVMGMEYCSNGCQSEAIPSRAMRLGKSFNPMEAGR